MLVKAYSAAVNGLEVTTITVEVSLTRGVSYRLTGLGDEAVRESRDRIAAALLNTGLKFPVADITANLSPASLRKVGSGFDLPLAVAILAANGDIPSDRLGSYMLVGELSLDGSLQPVKGVLPIAIRARKDQMKGLIVPKANEHEAAVVNQLDVYGMSSITEVIRFLKGDDADFSPCVVDTRKEFYEQQEWHFSRIPVYDKSKEYITGYVLKDMVLKSLSDDKFQTKLSDLARPILSFKEDESIYQIWEKMLEKREHISIITDEYGCLRGVVSMEDVIETMTGVEIVDEEDVAVDMQALAKEKSRMMLQGKKR